jgi:hypothetical protein
VQVAMLLQQGSDLMPKDWTGIIQAASKSPLGVRWVIRRARFCCNATNFVWKE